jgi:hypothetical protein
MKMHLKLLEKQEQTIPRVVKGDYKVREEND